MPCVITQREGQSTSLHLTKEEQERNCGMKNEDRSTSCFQIREMPERLRPREQMERLGAEHVSDDVLLAILLRSGARGVNVLDLSRKLLCNYGSLNNLAQATTQELAGLRGIGRVKALAIKAALELAKRASEESLGKCYSIRSPEDVSMILREQARTL
jgi:DNA repair protein RadC